MIVSVNHKFLQCIKVGSFGLKFQCDEIMDSLDAYYCRLIHVHFK